MTPQDFELVHTAQPDPAETSTHQRGTHTDNNTIQIILLGTMANDIGAIVLRDDIGGKPKT